MDMTLINAITTSAHSTLGTIMSYCCQWSRIKGVVVKPITSLTKDCLLLHFSFLKLNHLITEFLDKEPGLEIGVGTFIYCQLSKANQSFVIRSFIRSKSRIQSKSNVLIFNWIVQYLL